MVPLKNIAIGSLVIIIAFGLLSFALLKNKITADKGFAVVELFTSEGCLSCPPADALIEKIQKESNDQPVYILAFHVDYWNRLGWKDSFSSAAFSKRQNQYARWLKAGVYTPQAVVNGSKEFVGSQEGTLRSSIKDQLQKTSSARVNISNIRKDSQKVSFQYLVQLQPANTSLLLALVEKNAVSKVLRGENEGRTLTHVQIVLSLQNIDINGRSNGTGTLDIPKGLDNNGLEIIAFLQNNSNGGIIAATKSGI